jgi:hypothetical protein
VPVPLHTPTGRLTNFQRGALSPVSLCLLSSSGIGVLHSVRGRKSFRSSVETPRGPLKSQPQIRWVSRRGASRPRTLGSWEKAARAGATFPRGRGWGTDGPGRASFPSRVTQQLCSRRLRPNCTGGGVGALSFPPSGSPDRRGGILIAANAARRCAARTRRHDPFLQHATPRCPSCRPP